MKSELRVLLAPDSFKGSLRASKVCKYLREGILEWNHRVKVTELPLADGGEGTVEAMVEATGGRYCTISVHNPLMQSVKATYGLIHHDQVAVIEMAAASGLELIDENERDPMITTTYGTGELILDALDKGCRRFIIGIGGSATNDGGAGMLEAMGLQFHTNQSSKQLSKGGGGLSNVSSIDFSLMDKRLEESHFQIACDVTNPLLGEHGATYVYGSQKGAQPEDLPRLESGLRNWGTLLEEKTGRSIMDVPGSGAAGGLGAGFLALPHANLEEGIKIIQETLDLETHIKETDLIITGEGKVDGQTAYGKVVSGVGKLAQKHHKPVVCLAGTVGEGSENLLDQGITAIFSIVNGPMSLEEAIKATPVLLTESAKNVMGLLHALKRVDH